MTMLKPKEMAERLGVTVRTLQIWDSKGVLKAYRTPTNRRYYTEEQYLNYIGKSELTKRKNVAYARVSTNGQKDDLKNQIGFIRQYVNAKGVVLDETMTDVESSPNLCVKYFSQAQVVQGMRMHPCLSTITLEGAVKGAPSAHL